MAAAGHAGVNPPVPFVLESMMLAGWETRILEIGARAPIGRVVGIDGLPDTCLIECRGADGFTEGELIGMASVPNYLAGRPWYLRPGQALAVKNGDVANSLEVSAVLYVDTSALD